MFYAWIDFYLQGEVPRGQMCASSKFLEVVVLSLKQSPGKKLREQEVERTCGKSKANNFFFCIKPLARTTQSVQISFWK